MKCPESLPSQRCWRSLPKALATEFFASHASTRSEAWVESLQVPHLRYEPRSLSPQHFQPFHMNYLLRILQIFTEPSQIPPRHLVY
jgi:hypothetical protein